MKKNIILINFIWFNYICIDFWQAQKFHNTPLEETIRTTPTAEQAFDIGTSRHSEHPLRADWEAVKVGIQYKAVRAKVDQHEDFKRLLLATGTSNLIHATPSESFWGRPTYILEPYKRLDDKTKGELPTTNVVGCMYMDIRDELLNGGIPADQIYLKNTSVKWAKVNKEWIYFNFFNCNSLN